MKIRMAASFLVLPLILSCSPLRPVLYPNDRFRSAGPEGVERDIDQCMQLARESGAQGDRSARIAKETGKGAAVGGVTGAVVGAISGDLLKGGVIGAAGAGTAALASGVVHSDEPDPVFRRFVEYCLGERGYQVIGWR